MEEDATGQPARPRAAGRSVGAAPELRGDREALELPLRDRNLLLISAGFAAMYRETPYAAPEMADAVYGADWVTGGVFQLIAGDQTLSPPLTVAAGLNGPEGIAVEADGSLLIVESGARRLLRLDPAAGAVHVIDDDLAVGTAGVPFLAPWWLFSDVSAGDFGVIHLTEEAGRRIKQYIPRP